MLKEYRAVRSAANLVAEAAERTNEALVTGRVEQEPQFTDRMLGRIEQALEGYESHGISWRAKTLTDRGPNAQEKRYGADFMGVVSIRLPNLRVDKGFLAQAKLHQNGSKIPKSEYERMQEQCEDMLRITPDSFVFIYSNEDIRVVPAITIYSCNYVDPYDLYTRSVARFYEEHFSCFIGDRRISTPSIDVLISEAIDIEFHAKKVLALYASAS